MDYEYLFIGFVRRPTIPRYRVANTSTTVLPGKHTCTGQIHPKGGFTYGSAIQFSQINLLHI